MPMSLTTEDLTLIYFKERRRANFSKSDLHPLPRSNPLVRPSSTRSTLRAKSALMLSERISLALLWQPSLSFLPCWHERDPQCHFRTRTDEGRFKGLNLHHRARLSSSGSLSPSRLFIGMTGVAGQGNRRGCSKTVASIIGFSSRAQCQPSHVSLVLGWGIFVSSMELRVGGESETKQGEMTNIANSVSGSE